MIDEYGRCWRTEQEIIDLLYLDNLEIGKAIKEPNQVTKYNLAIDKYYLDIPKAVSDKIDIDLITFHEVNQADWFMPDDYRELDIIEWIINQCTSDEELNRIAHELILFQERNLLDVLRYLKYLVDVMRKNNIVWGVGRGSCTASYTLFKIGIHKIDSIKYDLDIGEFLKS